MVGLTLSFWISMMTFLVIVSSAPSAVTQVGFFIMDTDWGHNFIINFKPLGLQVHEIDAQKTTLNLTASKNSQVFNIFLIFLILVFDCFLPQLCWASLAVPAQLCWGWTPEFMVVSKQMP